MKHNQKNPLRLLLYLILPLMLIQCAPEESIAISNNADANTIRARFISSEELEGLPGVMDKLNSLPNSKNKRLASSSKFNFSVDTEQALLLEKGDYQSLSFPVHRSTPSKYMENLFLHPHKGSYLVYLIKYDFDVTDLKNLDEGKPIIGLLEKMKITPLNGFDMDLDTGYTQTTATTWGGGYEQQVKLVNGVCYVIDTIEDAGDGEVVITWRPCPGCCKDILQGGGGSGGGPTGITQQQYLALVDLIGSQGGPSSGGGGSTGGGGYMPGDGFYTPFNPVKPEQVDPMNPQNPHLYNPNPIIGVVSPNKPKVNPDDKNCEKLKKLTENLPNNGNEIRNKIIGTLQGAATNSTLKNEKGFSLEHSANGQTTLPPQPLEATSTPSGDAVKIKYGGKVYGAMHDHPFPNPGDPDKHVPMFSITDIFYFGYIAQKYNTDGQPKDYSNFVLTLTVSGGSEGSATSTYALKIDNWLQFTAFLNSYFAMSDKDRLNIGQRLAYKYTKLAEANSGAGPSDYMHVLFKFMENNNIGGVAIYKASDDLTQWSKQVYNPATNIITSKPCP